MSARPFQVGDPVLIDGTPGKIWWIDGPNPDDEFNGDFATVYIRYEELNEAGADGTAVIMTPDLTASKYPQRALVLRTAADDAGDPNAWVSTTAPQDGPEDGGADIDDDGTEAESLAEVSAPAFPDVLAHGRAGAA